MEVHLKGPDDKEDFVTHRLGLVRVVVLLLISGLGVITPKGAQAAGAHTFEYLVKYRSAQAIQTRQSISQYKLQLQDQNPAGHLLKVQVEDKNRLFTLLNLYSDSNVEYVVPNTRVYAMRAPVGAQELKAQWGLSKIQAAQAWERAGNHGSRQVLVAVIDTGVDYTHQALVPNMVPGYDFVKSDQDPLDENGSGHGTHCAGVIGATGMVDGGVTGISPEVSIMPIRFLDGNGNGDLNTAIKAVDYAIEKKAQIISASWGAPMSESDARPLLEAIERANKAGIIFVAAASNDGENNDIHEVYPAGARSTNVIAVAASNAYDLKPSWSNFGQSTVHLAAPGDAIVSTLPKGRYGSLSGTSMAAPMVAGLAALIKAQDPLLKPDEIRSILEVSGVKVNIPTACDCRIDALAAVEVVKSKKMFVNPQAGSLNIGEKLKFTGVYGTGPFIFAVRDPKVGKIDSRGVFQALSKGVTQVGIKDSQGQTAVSYKIFVGAKPDRTPGAAGKCPIGDPELCVVLCRYQPYQSFCEND